MWSTGGRAAAVSRAAGGRPDPAAIPGARRGPLPDRGEPELATLVAEAPRGDDWLHEIKFDGYRVVCRLERRRAAPVHAPRRRLDQTISRHSLDPLRKLPVEAALLDGEVVYVHDDGRTTFTALASALQGGSDPQGRIVYYVFDLAAPGRLRSDGGAARGPQGGAASASLRAGPPAPASGTSTTSGVTARRSSARPATSRSRARWPSAPTRPYRSGRGRDWVKVKCLRRQEFLIVGFTERTGVSDRIGALLVGFHEGRDGPVVLRRSGRHRLGRQGDARPAQRGSTRSW